MYHILLVLNILFFITLSVHAAHLTLIIDNGDYQKIALLDNSVNDEKNIVKLSDETFAPGDVFRDHLTEGSLGPKMVWIPAGRFRMGDIQGIGSDNEKPVHFVSVKRFAMGKNGVTVGEFRQFVKATGYQTEAEQENGCYIWEGNDWKKHKHANWRNPYFSQNDDHPVVCISWNDAMVYVNWLSQQTGKNYRLPSEAEWEYAARAGTETQYWWGNHWDKTKANCSVKEDGFKYTAPVNAFKSNAFGLDDMLGNVWEWMADPWHENYQNAPTDSRVWNFGPKKNKYRVLRGGAWPYAPNFCRTANRDWGNQTYRFYTFGFRVART
ncbi:Protein of unknown function DUF323 [Beggiatoa sp. PS]|nr:Protein of unknown function DUF323 [Beggiatoa sp. PS]